MDGLKEIRTRINSIASTQKITAAMKLISAAKLRKAQETLSGYQNFSKGIQNAMQLIASSIKKEGPLFKKWFKQPKELQRVALVVITSNSSMCGGFNQNLVKIIAENRSPGLSVNWKESAELYCLGKKGYDSLKKSGYNIVYNDTELVHKPNYHESSRFIQMITQQYAKQRYEAIFVAFNEFINPSLQKPAIWQILPFKEPENGIIKDNLIIEPTKDYLIEELVPLTLETIFYEMILKNSAGEHGARMTSMHQATENAMELSKELKLQYNKARQAAITNEILEIVSGAEALKG